MRIYLDLDCLTKLVAFGLFDEAMEMLGADDIWIANTFPFTCDNLQKKSEKKKEDEKAKAYADARKRMEAFEVIEETQEERELMAQLSRTGIDAGEAILLTRLATDSKPSRLLATGDKRFINTLGDATDLPPVFENCKGRIVSLDFLIARFVDSMEFAELVRLMTTPLSQSMDKVMKMAFTADTTPERTLEYLRNYAPPANDFMVK